MRPRKSSRGAYRTDFAAELARIEARRRALGVSHAELAERAGLTRSTLHRLNRSGRAFRRQIVALRLTLRSLAKERQRGMAMMPDDLQVI